MMKKIWILCAGVGLLLIGCTSTEEIRRDTAGDRVMPSGVTAVNLSSLNSTDDDFAPSVLPISSIFYFTSNRSKGGEEQFLDAGTKYGEEIYASNGKAFDWSAPTRSRILGEGSVNSGTMSVTADEKVGYFSTAYRTGGVGGTDIYRTYMAGMQWAQPECMMTLSSPWWDGHPAITPDGSTIIFASDRGTAATAGVTTEGAMQRLTTDLWMARMTSSGVWGLPVELPPPINSPQSEISPFFGPDGYLYFATDRGGSGFDIVRSRQVDGVWSEPELLGEPVNSPSDDCFPFLTPDRQTIYFASNRPGGMGGLDLYGSPFPFRILLKGVITLVDEVKKETIPGASLEISIEDLETREIQRATTDARGGYSFQLKPDRSYSIVTGQAECFRSRPPDELRVGVPTQVETVIVRDYSLNRVVFPTFELGRYNIPFFVTGYYIPNTPDNLVALDERLRRGELDISEDGRTPYIDPDDENYQRYADSIRAIFETVYRSIQDNILPLFKACAYSTELLKIEVQGFVDPRGLVQGIYVDKTVTTDSMTIQQGSRMYGQEGNMKLANLRAFHTLEMIDREMAGRSEEYRRLKAAGRILYSSYGKGIDVTINPGKAQDPAKRRIDITLSIDRPNNR